jgi:hypothetical protein
MTIQEWVRYRITGASNAAPNKPTDPQLKPLVDSFLRKAKRTDPCIFTSGVLNLTGDDEQDFNEWAGRTISMEYANSPVGKALIDLFYGNSGKVVQIESDDNTIKYGTGVAITADSLIAEDFIKASEAKNRITCIAEANALRSTSPLFRVASRRAAINAQCRANRGY